MEQENYPAAKTVIESIPVEHKLRTPEALEKDRMLSLIQMLKEFKDNGRSLLEMDSAEVQQATAFIQNAYDRPTSLVSNLLCYGYGICRPPLTGGEVDLMTKHLPYTPLPAQWEHLKPVISIKPNPASNWVEITYDLQIQTPDAMILIHDAMGRVVHSEKLKDRQGKLVWDSRSAAAGSYTIVLRNGKENAGSEQLIIQR